MTITQAVTTKINAIPKGKVFGYEDVPNYAKSSAAVIKVISRMVGNKKLNRLSKGKFYVPKSGLLGLKKPSDDELLRTELYKKNRLCGYITGLSFYNKLGLTTQVPRTITIACNGGRQKKNYKTIQIKKITTPVPINEDNIKLLQYLDALKDIKKIPDSDINVTLKRMSRFISDLSAKEQKLMLDIAITYYTSQVKALVGMIFSSLNIKVPCKLSESLNPITIYKLNLDHKIWLLAKEWNIK